MRTILIGSDTVALRRGSVEEIIDVRHAVLRAGLARETAVFSGDDLPTTRHYAALARGAEGEGKAVCCLTLLRSEWEGQSAWQLRGMATMTGLQRSGIGRELVRYAEEDARGVEPGVRVMWCNARVGAAGFYERLGWEIVSREPFELPHAGMHVKMRKRME
jgi:GNAT superfamily N-acetyltransferase